MLTITLEQANAIDFELDLNGEVSGQVKVVFTIDCGDVAMRFNAAQREGTAWQVAIPQSVIIPLGEYTFFIDVYLDNHVYSAMSDKVQVKKPFKPVATMATKEAPATQAPAPTARMTQTTTTTTKAPDPVVREVREATSMPHAKASTVRRILREH